MSWWKIAKVSAPPCEPAPTCLIAVMRAGISPSLSAKSRLDTYCRTNSPILVGRSLCGSTPWSCAERLGFAYLLQEHQLRIKKEKRHTSGRSPVAHLTVKTLRTLIIRLLCPAPANATIASKLSCLAPEDPGALTGASLTCGSDATPVLLRPFSPMTLRASLYLSPP